MKHITNWKVETGIPVPNGRLAHHGKYPFHLLKKAGQSLLIPTSYATTQQVPSAAGSYRKKHPKFRYAVRRCAGGCRIWRI